MALLPPKNQVHVERAPARVFFANPDTCRSIAALNTEDLGTMQTGKILYVSPNTVQAVCPCETESRYRKTD